MAYNNNAEVDGVNRPHFYVSERCENIIWALQEYTGALGPDETAKDPIDVLRYAAVEDISFIDPSNSNNFNTRKGGY
jgi:hypothetical protein